MVAVGDLVPADNLAYLLVTPHRARSSVPRTTRTLVDGADIKVVKAPPRLNYRKELG